MRHDPITIAWLIWLVVWIGAAFRVKRVARRESTASRAAFWMPLLVGAVLLIMNRPDDWLGATVYPLPFVPRYYTGLALVIAGIVFSIWARVHLGGNWSGSVTVKAGHELIRTGPYRFVRHPIYTGLLCSILGTAIAEDQWRALLALVIIGLAVWRKWRVEERFMEETFGDAYRSYRQDVPAIIPGPHHRPSPSP